MIGYDLLSLHWLTEYHDGVSLNEIAELIYRIDLCCLDIMKMFDICNSPHFKREA